MQRIIWLTQPGMEPFAGAQHHAMQQALQDAGYDVQVQYYQPRLTSWKNDRCDLLIWSFVPSQVDVWAGRLYASRQMAVVHELDPRQQTYPAVDQWCVPSESMRNQLRQSGVAAERVCIASGYMPVTKTGGIDLREQLGVDDETLLIYSGGPLVASAGNRLAVWVLILLQQIEAPVRLILHGSGLDREPVEHWMQALDDQQAVYFAPAQASVHDLVAQSDVVWLPRTSDGVPDALWAGLALGKPVMASKVPSLQEILRDGENALLMGGNHPPAWASAIQRMLADRSIMKRMGQATRTLLPMRMRLPEMFEKRAVAMAA